MCRAGLFTEGTDCRVGELEPEDLEGEVGRQDRLRRPGVLLAPEEYCRFPP